MKAYTRVREYMTHLGEMSSDRWRYLVYTLSPREKRKIAVLLLIAAVIAFGASMYEYWIVRDQGPARGGGYSEGIIGAPRFLNPILAF